MKHESPQCHTNHQQLCSVRWLPSGPYTLYERQIQALLLPTSTSLSNTVTKALSWFESSCLEGLVEHKHLVLQGNMQICFSERSLKWRETSPVVTEWSVVTEAALYKAFINLWMEIARKKYKPFSHIGPTPAMDLLTQIAGHPFPPYKVHSSC